MEILFASTRNSARALLNYDSHILDQSPLLHFATRVGEVKQPQFAIVKGMTMLCGWPIRRKLQIALGMLLLMVVVLSFSGIRRHF